MAFAQYDLTTGQIYATTITPLNETSVGILKENNKGQVEVPDDIDLHNAKIDLNTLSVIPINAGV